MINRISEKALNMLEGFEGLKLRPYLDSANIPTIGYGTLRYPNGKRVTMFDAEITQKQAQQYLLHDLEYTEDFVNAYTRDDINQNQFDACVLFTYNVGVGAYKMSTLAKLVNANPNNPKIYDEFLKWNKAGGKIVKGLQLRRVREANLYFGK